MRNFQSSLYEGSELDNCDDKAFSVHNLWLLSRGGVSSPHPKGGLLSILNSIKGKCEGLGGRGLSFNSYRQPRFFTFSFAFFLTPLGEKVSTRFTLGSMN